RTCPTQKVSMLPGRPSPEEMAETLQAGAHDYLNKPFGLPQLRSRVRAALELKDAQDRTDALNQHLREANAELEKSLAARNGDLLCAQKALVLAMAKLVER